MSSLLQQLRLTLLLHFRNRIALLYSYLFPTIFLIAFWVLYRYEVPPIARHVGELLTVTAMGGACFGLPTAMVAERERGVWRRYRLAPVSTTQLVATTVIGRYFLLLTAGILQVVLALLIGMPFPEHPFDLFVVFTFVCFAFMGLGLVIAVLADNVPAVQALGQCIFLPMLIIGGVAVRLERLPEWAQHVSLFFPGRYAVESIQATVTGDGMGTVGFALLALVLIAIAGSVAGAKMFRWDAQQRFRAHQGKGWLGVALASWLLVGVLAETTGRVGVGGVGARTAGDGGNADLTTVLRSAAANPSAIGGGPSDSVAIATGDSVTAPADTTPATPDSAETALPSQPADTTPRTATTEPPAVATAPTPAPAAPAAPWEALTIEQIEGDVLFDRLPPDEGVVAPIASSYAPYPETECMKVNFPIWAPGQVADPVQRVRNLLYVAAVPDLFQMEDLERNIPLVVQDQLLLAAPRDNLVKILYYIASNPRGGEDGAADTLRGLCLDISGPSDVEEMRDRAALYALKFLGRLLGKLPLGQ